jgi:2',3'-cyclic-nucleotide 2'-phosphodiesterase (5'-nucleotidase family)
MPAVRAATHLLAFALIATSAACSGSSGARPAEHIGTSRSSPPAAHHARRVKLAVIGTSDLHGHIDMLPGLAGHLANLRASGEVDGMLLVDGGDLFQGTLESNPNEGAAVIAAYNQIGYAASAVGNHEFDFGPEGERAVPGPGDDPRGALKARAAAAHFPFLAANVLDSATGRPVAWPHFAPSVMVERAGVRIGIIGLSTESTPHTTMSSNFAGLSIAPLAPAVAAEAARLRSRGAQVIVVAAHAGGRCRDFDDPRDAASCEPDQEIFEVARALPPHTVDVIVGGHTHAGVAHEVAGVAIVQSFSNGAAFGRVDLVVDPARRGGAVVERRIHPPRFVCGDRPTPSSDRDAEPTACQPAPYAGRPVVPDRRVAAIVAPYIESARKLRDTQLGVVVDSPVRRAWAQESALGNLFADLMRQAGRDADVAITNGGGLRADLPAGPLTYGALYQAMPFDNRFARVRVTGAQLGHIVAGNVMKGGGIFSLSGVRASARCRGGELAVSLRREDGRRVRDRDQLLLLTSDFLATGGDGMLAGLDLPDGAVRLDEGAPIRDALAEVLRARGGHLSGDDRHVIDKRAPRIALPGPRPVKCK